MAPHHAGHAPRDPTHALPDGSSPLINQSREITGIGSMPNDEAIRSVEHLRPMPSDQGRFVIPGHHVRCWPMREREALPRVTILMATHNGEAHLREQLDTILSQEGVDLHLIVSDDASRDSTPQILADAAAADSRITLLPTGRFGSPSANFYRLLTEADYADADFIGFADQDDRWRPGKLARHASILIESAADGVSSNVVAFDEDGSERLIRKDFPQQALDYCFETPGPGSSMLLTARLARMITEQLKNPVSPARNAWSHDLLFYALARAAGLTWIIDPEPTVEYRQHAGNAIGANGTVRAAAKRLHLTATRWHRKLVAIVTESAIHVATPEELPRLVWLHEMLANPTPRNLARIAARTEHLRRRTRDQIALRGLLLGGLW